MKPRRCKFCSKDYWRITCGFIDAAQTMCVDCAIERAATFMRDQLVERGQVNTLAVYEHLGIGPADQIRDDFMPAMVRAITEAANARIGAGAIQVKGMG